MKEFYATLVKNWSSENFNEKILKELKIKNPTEFYFALIDDNFIAKETQNLNLTKAIPKDDKPVKILKFNKNFISQFSNFLQGSRYTYNFTTGWISPLSWVRPVSGQNYLHVYMFNRGEISFLSLFFPCLEDRSETNPGGNSTWF